MKCTFCKNNHKTQLVKKYRYWTVLLTRDQYYLGRCRIKLNRHIVDFLQIKNKERKELLKIMKELKDALNAIFKPDLFNYAFLGNEIRHLHLHFIPRYKGERVFENIKFKDVNWNRNCWPHKEFEVSASVMNKLKEIIREKL